MEAGVLDESRLKAALAEQRKWGGRLGRTVVEMGFVDESAMCRVLAQQLRLATIALDTDALPDRITEHLRLDLAERYGVFPVGYDPQARTLSIATSDPTNVEALQEIEFATSLKITPVVATASSIDRAVRRYYFGESTSSTRAATPGELGMTETAFELDQLLSAPAASPRPPAPRPSQQPPPPPPPDARPEVDALRKEIAILREQVDGMEGIISSQVRALRSLLEILIESGLITRDEYLERIHRHE
ncbi:MAG: general secretion pathway protein GspE [Archangiaceae bacterium]|nr:general secretion pathway protein GspE [Archangiaceae bacterium]